MSKAALEILALTYAAECETTKIKVNLINPGPMRTAMRKKAMPGEDPAYLVKPEEMAFKVVEMLSPRPTTATRRLLTFKNSPMPAQAGPAHEKLG